MALVYEGMKVSVKDAPSGYVLPSVDGFSDWQYKLGMTILVLTSSVQDADEVTTFTALVAALEVIVQSKLADFEEATGSPTAYANMRTAVIVTGNKYGDDSENYQCTVDVFIKTLL